MAGQIMSGGAYNLALLTVLVAGMLGVTVATARRLALADRSGVGPAPVRAAAATWLAFAGTAVAIAATLSTLGWAPSLAYVDIHAMNLVPLETIGRYVTALERGSRLASYNLAGNLALLVPVGVALALHPRVTARRAGALLVGLSTFIEVAQAPLGRITDVDDIILNVTGAMAAFTVVTVAGLTLRATRERVQEAA